MRLPLKPAGLDNPLTSGSACTVNVPPSSYGWEAAVYVQWPRPKDCRAILVNGYQLPATRAIKLWRQEGR